MLNCVATVLQCGVTVLPSGDRAINCCFTVLHCGVKGSTVVTACSNVMSECTVVMSPCCTVMS